MPPLITVVLFGVSHTHVVGNVGLLTVRVSWACSAGTKASMNDNVVIKQRRYVFYLRRDQIHEGILLPDPYAPGPDRNAGWVFLWGPEYPLNLERGEL